MWHLNTRAKATVLWSCTPVHMNSCMLSSWKGHNHSAVLWTYLRSHLWPCVFIQVQCCGEWCEHMCVRERIDHQLKVRSKQGPGGGQLQY